MGVLSSPRRKDTLPTCRPTFQTRCLKTPGRPLHDSARLKVRNRQVHGPGGRWLSGWGCMSYNEGHEGGSASWRAWGGDEGAAAGLRTASSSRPVVSPGARFPCGSHSARAESSALSSCKSSRDPPPAGAEGRAPAALESKGGPVGQGLYSNPSLTLLLELTHPLGVSPQLT